MAEELKQTVNLKSRDLIRSFRVEATQHSLRQPSQRLPSCTIGNLKKEVSP